MSSRRLERLAPIPSLFILCATLCSLAYVSLRLHYRLPTPLIDQVNSVTGLPQLSEHTILADARYLSEVIGYRTVGTREHAVADRWLLDKANALKSECEDIVSRSSGSRVLECEVWHQEGDGTHRFDMMDKAVYKRYMNLTNIVLRLSDGTAAGKADAILVNSHLDSTLPSPGAADDAMPVGIMLDCVRVLINTPDWSPKHAIIFLWNNAEESLQDGSHLFATQHEIAPTVRAVINLEAAGTTGPALLFQATSEEMIEAYSHVPRPYGTVLANDVFSSGIILSDTDFRQFQEYRNLTGLDMAIVGDSYLYHTRKDIVSNIQAGVTQHLAENVLALLIYLSAPGSPIPNLDTFTPPATSYFAIAGHIFVMYSFKTAIKMYTAVLVISLAILIGAAPLNVPRRTSVNIRAALGVIGGLITSVISANLVALMMTRFLGKGMSWFAREWYCIALYGTPALAGLLAFQLLISSRLSPTGASHLEYATLSGIHMLFASMALLLQLLGIGSGGIFFFWSTSSTAALLLQFILSSVSERRARDDVWLGVHLVAQLAPIGFGMEVATALLDIFVPLTGRMGDDAPVEHIIATISALLVFLCVPFSISLAHRFGRRSLLVAVIFLTTLSAIFVGIFASPMHSPFDDMHPKRVYVLHTENITSGEFSLHVSASDAAPGFYDLVSGIANEFGSPGQVPKKIVMDEWNPDWDVLYPFSQFLTPYKLSLPRLDNYASPWAAGDRFRVSTIGDVWDEKAGTRSFTLVIDHPGIIWTVIAFDAHVVSWTLDKKPPPRMTRHHVKEASFYGVDQWTIDLILKVETPKEKLSVNFVGIQEKSMFPGKVAEGEGPAMELFGTMDSWFNSRAHVDAMFLGTVAGVAIV